MVFSQFHQQLNKFKQLAQEGKSLTAKQELEFNQLAKSLRDLNVPVYDLLDLADPQIQAPLDYALVIANNLSHDKKTEVTLVNLPPQQAVQEIKPPLTGRQDYNDKLASSRKYKINYEEFAEKNRLRLMRESIIKMNALRQAYPGKSPAELADLAISDTYNQAFIAPTEAAVYAVSKSATPYDDLYTQQQQVLDQISKDFDLNQQEQEVVRANYLSQNLDPENAQDILATVAAARLLATEDPANPIVLAEEPIIPAKIGEPTSSTQLQELLHKAHLDSQTDLLLAQQLAGDFKSHQISSTRTLQAATALPTPAETPEPSPLIFQKLNDIANAAPGKTQALVSTGARGVLTAFHHSDAGQQALKQNGVNFNTTERYVDALQKRHHQEIQEQHLFQFKQQYSQSHPNSVNHIQNAFNQYRGMYDSAKGVLQQIPATRNVINSLRDQAGQRLGVAVLSGKAKQFAVDKSVGLLTKVVGKKVAEKIVTTAAEKGLTAGVTAGLAAALGVSTGGLSLILTALWEGLKLIRKGIDNLVRSLLGNDELYKIYKGLTDWKTWGAGLTAATLGFAGVISAFTAGVIGAITFTFISPLIFAAIIGLVIFFWIPTINIAPLLSTITHLDSGIGAGEQRITVPGGVCWPTDGLITQLDKIDSPGHDPQHGGASMLDIGSNNGGAVYAPFAGSYVFYPDNGSPGGNRIEGTSLDGSLAAAFLHLASATFPPASSNAFNTGDVIGYVDNSGTNTTGPHLHFEIFKGPHIYNLFPMPDKPYLNKPVSHTQCSAGSVATNTNDCSKDGPYGPNYSPANLVTVSDPGGYFADKSQLQAPAAAAVTSFLRDMNTTSNPLLQPGQRITIYHGYRSYEDQLDLCVDCAARKADSDPSNDNCLAAPAAYSNHRAGLAADLYVYDTKTKAITDLTPSLKAKAASYGLINLAGDPPHFDYKK